MKETIKTIGILGGMGPGASAKMYADLVTLAQKKYHAVQDTEYPPMLLYSLPLVGFDETGVTNPETVKKQLCDAAQVLENGGSDFIVIACNTVHIFIEDIRKAVSIPVLSMIDETIAFINQLGIKTAGLLSSETTRDLDLYQNAFQKAGIKIIQATENEQKDVTAIIKNAMGGTQGEKDSSMLSIIINRLVSDGATCAVLGCTELPLVANNLKVSVPVFDTMTILTSAALHHAYT